MTTGTTLTDACAIHLGEKIGRGGAAQRIMVLPNPVFEEWLMRLPGNWSKLESPPLETDKTPSLPLSPSACSVVTVHPFNTDEGIMAKLWKPKP